MFDIFNMIKKDKSAARKVTRQTIIGDILDMDQSTAPYFMAVSYTHLGGHGIHQALPAHSLLYSGVQAAVQSLGYAPHPGKAVRAGGACAQQGQLCQVSGSKICIHPLGVGLPVKRQGGRGQIVRQRFRSGRGPKAAQSAGAGIDVYKRQLMPFSSRWRYWKSSSTLSGRR